MIARQRIDAVERDSGNGPVIAVRPYCHTDHYWQVYFDTNAAIIRTAQEAQWPAPTPASIVRTVPNEAG